MEEYDLKIAYAKERLDRAKAVRDNINSGLTKTTSVKNTVCAPYDLWQGRWNKYKDDVHTGQQSPVEVYDCDLSPFEGTPNYDRDWCDGYQSAQLTRPCTSTRAEYDQ